MAQMQPITLVVEQITEREMRQRIARAKADALLDFAQELPEFWASLRHIGLRGERTSTGLVDLLEERANQIMREVSDVPEVRLDSQTEDRSWVAPFVEWVESNDEILDFGGAKVPELLQRLLERHFTEGQPAPDGTDVFEVRMEQHGLGRAITAADVYDVLRERFDATILVSKRS